MELRRDLAKCRGIGPPVRVESIILGDNDAAMPLAAHPPRYPRPIADCLIGMTVDKDSCPMLSPLRRRRIL